MSILDRYLWKATLSGFIMAWFALVTLIFFFSFIAETGKTNALYTTSQAFVYLIYTIPGLLYEHFPTSILIGALLGLGNLAANSEFTAMRAAGISIRQIIFSIVKLGLVLAFLIFIAGEWLVPATDLHARNFKAHLKNKNITLVGGAGLWIKEKNTIFHIGKVIKKEQLSDISIYSFEQNYSGLKSIKTVNSANFINNSWQLKDINTSIFKETSIEKKHQDKELNTHFIDPQILDVATVDAEQLSTNALKKIIKHQKDNQLKTDKYELIYWKRYSVPLSALVMLIIAMPFLFGSNRGGGAGTRVFLGIIVGIAFFLANRAINELGIVYGFSPMLSAFAPSLLFLSVGLLALNRIR